MKVIVVMGVSGCGKTTIGRALAESLGWDFIDADDYHPPENVAKMASGVPLTEQDRQPWLDALRREIARRIEHASPAVLACSALTARSRAKLTVDAREVRFVHLTGDPAKISERLASRSGHFMPAHLLASQLATLEPPTDALDVDLALDQAEIVARIRAGLDLG